MNIIYLRVSKEDEEEQDPEQQLKEIIKKFNLKEYKLYEERGSAWDLNKIHKRKDFLEILNILFDADKTTIKDIYLGKVPKKEINYYVWDYARTIRNIELNVLFSMLSEWANVKIHSWKDRTIFREPEEGVKEPPTARMGRLMMNTISAFSSEEYSYTISENTKKAYAGEGVSTYGNKWGRQIKDIDGNALSIDEVKELNKYIKSKLKLMSRTKVLELVLKKKRVPLSPSYLSKHFKKSL
jgi:DNA invertase Pin-like site-specific DNA recombinase